MRERCPDTTTQKSQNGFVLPPLSVCCMKPRTSYRGSPARAGCSLGMDRARASHRIAARWRRKSLRGDPVVEFCSCTRMVALALNEDAQRCAAEGSEM